MQFKTFYPVSITNISIISAIFMLSACAVTLTPGGTNVRLMKADPPAECKELGDVSGVGISANDLSGGKVDIRNKAAELGANYVRWDTVNQNVVTGTAYACPKLEEASSDKSETENSEAQKI